MTRSRHMKIIGKSIPDGGESADRKRRPERWSAVAGRE